MQQEKLAQAAMPSSETSAEVFDFPPLPGATEALDVCVRGDHGVTLKDVQLALSLSAPPREDVEVFLRLPAIERLVASVARAHGARFRHVDVTGAALRGIEKALRTFEYRPGRSLKSWAHLVGKQTVVDELRVYQRQTEHEVSAEAMAELVTLRKTGGDEEIAWADAVDKLYSKGRPMGGYLGASYGDVPFTRREAEAVRAYIFGVHERLAQQLWNVHTTASVNEMRWLLETIDTPTWKEVSEYMRPVRKGKPVAPSDARAYVDSAALKLHRRAADLRRMARLGLTVTSANLVVKDAAR